MRLRRVYVGLIRDHKTKIGRIKAVMVRDYGRESKVKNSKG